MAEPVQVEPEHHSLPIRRLLTIACVMAVGIAGIWMVIDRFSDVDVNDPPSASGTPAATPVAEADMPATPGDDYVIRPRTGSLPDLLRYAPDLLADDSLPLTDVGRYADIRTWMASQGLSTPDTRALPAWRAQLGALALTPGLADRALDPEWERAYGFDLRQVDQVLVAGQAPDYVTILRGPFDRTRLQDAWVSSGYQAVEVEGATIWTLFPGDTIDLSDTASRPAMGMMNNVVLFEDGTLVATAKLPRLRSVLRVVNGRASSLAENPSIASLVGPATDSEDLVSAVISRGSLLQALPSQLPSRAVVPDSPGMAIGQALHTIGREAALAVSMPAVELVLSGVLLSHAPESEGTPVAGAPLAASVPQMRLMLSYDGIDDARIARQVIGRRFNDYLSPITNKAYGERYGPARVRVLDAPGDPALVEMTATLPHAPAEWLAILRDRDLGFAFWLGPDASGDD